MDMGTLIVYYILVNNLLQPNKPLKSIYIELATVYKYSNYKDVERAIRASLQRHGVSLSVGEYLHRAQGAILELPKV